MAVFDSVINPADFRKIDPKIRLQIQNGFNAGVKAASVLEAQRLKGISVKPLTADLKKSVTAFNKGLK